MNAKEAKKIAFDFNTSTSNIEYTCIKSNIETAAKKGKYAISLANEPKSDVKKKLESEGFKISTYYDQRDGSGSTTLSWS